MDIPVIISTSFEELSEVKKAIDTVNRAQTYFTLSLVTVEWIPDGVSKKGIDQDRLYTAIERRFGKDRTCVIVQNPLKQGLFADGTSRTYVISTADWSVRYAPPPTNIYLIYMLACGLAELSHQVPVKVSNSLLHEPPIGCFSDYCNDKDEIKSSMRKAHICDPCKKTLTAHRVSKEALRSATQMLTIVKTAMAAHDQTRPHDAFICYSHADKKFAQRLANDLSASSKVWFDEFEMLPGESLPERIFKQGILKSSWFLIVLSPNSVQSDWCMDELSAALQVERERDNVFVIPVIHRECAIPALLEDKLTVDLRGKKYELGLNFILKGFKQKRRRKNLRGSGL
jgi:hypothetical protein